VAGTDWRHRAQARLPGRQPLEVRVGLEFGMILLVQSKAVMELISAAVALEQVEDLSRSIEALEAINPAAINETAPYPEIQCL
jgi:hypothetical protein